MHGHVYHDIEGCLIAADTEPTRLRGLRRELGLTQQEFAKKYHFTLEDLQRLESLAAPEPKSMLSCLFDRMANFKRVVESKIGKVPQNEAPAP